MVSKAHGALHICAYFEDTQELAILLEEMFRVSFPVFYIKYEAAFLAGHWTVTDPGPLLGRVLVKNITLQISSSNSQIPSWGCHNPHGWSPLPWDRTMEATPWYY
ncbi:hypothetical protein P692DRAFT_20816061 [Suillus brevipes Sb2]|nr:hypothetical protein P692DRAFT_20816061 [Suillus brevipes Sb2]